MKLTTNMLALLEQIIDQITRTFDQFAEETVKCNTETCSAELIAGVTQCIDKTLNEAARVGLAVLGDRKIIRFWGTGRLFVLENLPCPSKSENYRF